MSTTPQPMSDLHDRRRQDRRTELAQEITALGGNTDAFLRELDKQQFHLDDLIDRYIVQKENEYIKFANQLRDKYKFLARRPSIGSVPRSTRHIPLETTIQEQAVEPRSPGSRAAKYPRVDSNRPMYDRNSLLSQTMSRAGLSEKAQEATTPDQVSIGSPPDTASMTTDSATAPDRSQRRSSAIRSSATSPRASRKKRVSLVVGDEVVAPSDMVQGSLPAQGLSIEDSSHARLIGSLRKTSGNGSSARKPLSLDANRKNDVDKENADYDDVAPESPFLMDEEPSYMPAVDDDDDDDKDELDTSSDEMDGAGELSKDEMDTLSCSPALAIPRRSQEMPTARRQTFSLQMTPTVMQPVTSGFSMPSARCDPTGSPEHFEVMQPNNELMFGSLTQAGPGSFKSGSIGVSMIGAQLQSIYLSSNRDSKPV